MWTVRMGPLSEVAPHLHGGPALTRGAVEGRDPTEQGYGVDLEHCRDPHQRIEAGQSSIVLDVRKERHRQARVLSDPRERQTGLLS